MGTAPISGSFHHTDHLRLRLQLRTIDIIIMDNRGKIDFKNGFMDFLLQKFGNMLKMETARTLYQNQFILKFPD